MARIIAITNQKGGVGKTTTSVNLSACVAAEGRRVLVVDADPQGNTSSGLGVRVREKTPTIYEVMAGNVRLEDALVKTAQDNLMLLPSDIRLAGAEIELADMDRREHVIAQALSPAKVVGVFVNEHEKAAKVVVLDNQLSLAIGKEGQNARLAARLTGYKIDIKPKSYKEEE